MSRPLPFDDFLDALRGHGFAVGLHEHMALGRLLARWDGVDAGALGASIAALVARSELEVVEARRLFDVMYGEAAGPAAGDQTAVPTDGAATVVRMRWWQPAAALAAIAAVLVLAVAAGYYYRPAVVAPPSYEEPPPAPAPPPDGPVETLSPTPPPLPDPPARAATGAIWQSGLAIFAGVFAAAWMLSRRRAHRVWIDRSWREALGAVPGPYRLQLHLRGSEARLPRADVEDAAVILGRIYRTEERTRELDPRESLRETLRRGLLPCLVFRRVRTARPILVLQDIGPDMRPWRPKIERLLLDLRRQGVALERWHFTGDPRRVSERPHGAPQPLEVVMGHRPDCPVLVISAGGGLAALGDDGWLRTLAGAPHRAWLTPVGDPALWPPALGSDAVRAWPMSRDGLTNAVRALAGHEMAEAVRVAVLAEGRVLQDDVERLKRLASLVPHPTPELLEWLRQRFAPDVPEAAVVHVTAAAHGAGMREIRLSDAEVRRLASAMRAETPALEAAVRRDLLRALQDSEPTAGSVAHLRWQLAVALQQAALAELGHGDAAAPRAVLDALGHGPLWEEVHEATALVIDTSATPGAPREVARPPAGPSGAALPPPRVAPGWRELVLAGASTAACLAVAWQAGVFPATAFARVANAYELRYATAEPPTLELRAAQAAEPLAVDLYRDGQLVRSGIGVALNDVTRLDVTNATGSTYQVQAVRPDGNVAESNPVWVPDADRVVVLIDAHPWARVTITRLVPAASQRAASAEAAGDTLVRGEPTPLRVALRPGRYQLDLENGGVTGPLQEAITVAAGTPGQRFVFDMPGFDPATAAQGSPPAAAP